MSLSTALDQTSSEIGAESFPDPVFVLCNSRSGSTLLRFMLDAHPQLACPPETNLPALCAQLATVWSLIEGAPLSMNRGDEPPAIPDAAIRGARTTLNSMLGPYLTRRSKARYCDKSLGTARFAELLARLYPQAQFLCLYRHPMDVIASGMEACPFGLNGYGFDPYIATTPGNAVLALARFWADNTASTLAVEERFGDRCLRLRYEDLVADPEKTAATIFAFLRVDQAAGISTTCFSQDRERFGPADYKIWYTSQISSDSVGRGWSVPAAMIAPPVLAAVNELAEKLGYIPVDGEWGTSEPPKDIRAPMVAHAVAASLASDDAAPDGPASEDDVITGPAQSNLLGSRLEAGLRDVSVGAASCWELYGAETVVAIWLPRDPKEPAEHWLIDLKSRDVTLTSRAAQDESDWDIVGSADTWEQILSGRLNLSVALRACQLRYCDSDEGGPLAFDARISILADLLALTNW